METLAAFDTQPKKPQITWSLKQVKISELTPFEKNPRKISPEKLELLSKSIVEDGYHTPIKATQDYRVIGGHQRIKALLKSGFKKSDSVNILVPDRELTDKEFQRINVRDNIEFGEWDASILVNEFESDDLIEWGLTKDVFGGEIDVIEPQEIDNDVPELKGEPITKLGDIWQLGEHRLMCGDSTNIIDVENLLELISPDVIYTDPPYGLGIQRSGSDKTKAWAEAKTAMLNDNDNQVAIDVYNLVAALDIPVQIFWGANYYASALKDSRGWIVWDKKVTGNFSHAELAWTNIDKPIKVFSHTWNGFQKESEKGEKRVHPTQKPIELALWCLEEYAPESVIVLDLFGGSGTTLIACEKSNRQCLMMELSPNYCDVIIARWEKVSGKKAQLLS